MGMRYYYNNFLETVYDPPLTFSAADSHSPKYPDADFHGTSLYKNYGSSQESMAHNLCLKINVISAPHYNSRLMTINDCATFPASFRKREYKAERLG